jgi:hypothetical protein
MPSRRRPLSTVRPLLALLLPIGLFIGVGGCRAEAPERPPQRPAEGPSPTVTVDTSGPSFADSAVTGVQAPDHGQRERIDRTARTFLSAIETGDERTFGHMLSMRSRNFIKDIDATREIFAVAQDALGSVRGRSLTLLGGTPDSVALLLRGRRVDVADTAEEELILILLREKDEWKLMYPGLLRPRSHLLR